MTPPDTTPQNALSANCPNCGTFTIEPRDVFVASAVYCPTCTNRAELLPASA